MTETIPGRLTEGSIGAARGNRARAPRLLVCLCNIVLAILIVALTNHFLLDEVMERFYARMASPAIGLQLYDSAGSEAIRNRIVLFLLDDEDLATYGVPYPVPYAFHARRLRAIAAREPEAIFVDLWFHDQRRDDDITVLVEALCDIANDGIKLYLASLGYLGPQRQLHPALLAVSANGPYSSRKASRQCFTEVSPLKQTDVLDGTDWEYPLFASGPGGKLSSAAPAIYNHLYPESPLPERGHNLSLIWGARPHELTSQIMRDPHSGARRCRKDALYRGMLPFSHEALNALVPTRWLSKDVPVCPYHLVLPIRVLRDWSDSRNPFHPVLTPSISGRVVIYGLNLQSVSDTIRSPIHGPLPGAHLHAMALDNLLAYGNTYPVAQGFDFTLSRGTLVPLGLIGGLSLILVYWNTGAADRRASRVTGVFRIIGFTRILEAPKTSFLYEPLERLRELEFGGGRVADWFERKYRAIQPSRVASIARGLLILLAMAVISLRGGVSWLLRLAIAFIFLIALAFLSLSFFGLGPLSWIEFAVAPLVLELLGSGEKFANAMVLVRNAVNGKDWLK